MCHFFADCAEYRGAEADHKSGDWSDQLEEGGNQVQEKWAISGRPGVSQPTHVTERYDAFYLCYYVYREPIHLVHSSGILLLFIAMRVMIFAENWG